MTASSSRIVVRAGETRSKVVRVDTPSDQACEHLLNIEVEAGGILELQELHQAGAGEGAIRIQQDGSRASRRRCQGNPGAVGLLMRVRVALAAGAKMRHVAVVDPGGPGELRFDRRITLAAEADYHYTRVGAAGAPRLDSGPPLMGATAIDNELLIVSLNGDRCRFRHAALMLAEAQRSASLDLRMDHRARNTVSESLCRCILGANSTGRFTGRIAIAPEGQGADAGMRNDNLLLDETARMETQPELEVYADEVQCAHGAATGALDEAALFYLRSRGLSLGQARATLVRAFAASITEAIELADAQAMAGAALSRVTDRAAPRQLTG